MGVIKQEESIRDRKKRSYECSGCEMDCFLTLVPLHL